LSNIDLERTCRFGFDFDQTIADSSPGISQCLDIVAQTFDSKISKKEIVNLSKSGKSLSETLSAFIPPQELDSAARIFMDSYPVLGIQGTTLFSGVRELFRQLEDLSISIYIISSKSTQNLELSISHLGLQVEAFVGGMKLQGKADAISQLDIDYYVGDQMSDMQAANLAGAKGVLVNNLSEPSGPSETYFAKFQNILELNQRLSSILRI
jgi:phosphoglycolate phosphatase